MSIEKEKISEFYNNYEVINFGNPEDPKIMGQFVECVEGIKEAC